ncbi:MAG: DMT family transporter [Desulfobacteraceae bacterium]|nr:DMT family transporter [Desulfobacteraceae bacterium]
MCLNQKTRGLILIVLSAASFGLVPLCAKIAYANGLTPYSFILFRSIFAAGALFALLKRKKTGLAISPPHMATLFKASFFGYCMMMITLYVSYNYMASGVATTIHFVYPVATMTGAVLFFGEQTNARKVGALLVSLIGIYFLVGAGTDAGFSMTGAGLAFVSGLFYAYYILTVSYSEIKTMNSFVLVFYVSLFNAVTLFVICIFTGKLNLDFNATALLSVLMITLAVNIVGMVALQEGLKVINPSTATILSTFEPLTSLVIGVALLNETISWRHGAGSVLILISVVWMALSEKRLSRGLESLEQES